MVLAAVSAFAAIMIIGIAWNVMTPTMEEHVFDYCRDELTADNNFADFEPTWGIIDWTWYNWPLVMIFVVILFLFLASQRPQY